MSVDAAIDEHLESALETAEDDTIKFHLRQALQLRIIEAERSKEAAHGTHVESPESV